MTHTLTPREKPLGQVAYEGWAQGLPGCEWSNQTETQKRAWSKAAYAILTALASGSGDHAELARLAESLMEDARKVADMPRNDKRDEQAGYSALASVALTSLLAENAALRVLADDAAKHSMRQTDKLLAMHDRATEAERKLAEADRLLERIANDPTWDGPSSARLYFLSKEAERG